MSLFLKSGKYDLLEESWSQGMETQYRNLLQEVSFMSQKPSASLKHKDKFWKFQAVLRKQQEI